MYWDWYQYLILLLLVTVLGEYALVWRMATGGLAARRRRLGTEETFIPGHMVFFGWLEDVAGRLPSRCRPAENSGDTIPTSAVFMVPLPPPYSCPAP